MTDLSPTAQAAIARPPSKPVEAIPGPAYLVIDPHGLHAPQATLDADRAHEFARNTGCVVTALPVVADYRTDGTP